MLFRSVFVLGVATFGLSACLGGDIVTPLEARDLARRSASYDALRARHDDIPNSAWSAIPASGTATYNGVAALRVGEPGNRTQLAGDAQIDFDFQQGTVAGRLDRFFGVDNTRDLAEYRGSLVLSAGEIGMTRPNAWQADYAGTINGNGDRIVLDGQIIGDFVGTPIRAATASEADGDSAQMNGNRESVSLEIVAEP